MNKRLLLFLILIIATYTVARADTTITPTDGDYTTVDVGTLLNDIDILLPQNTDNRSKLASFSNQLIIGDNSDGYIDDLIFGFLDGSNGSFLTYTVTNGSNVETITVQDNFNGDDANSSTSDRRAMYLYSQQDNYHRHFSNGTTIEFHLTKNEQDGQLMTDYPNQRVIVFSHPDTQGLFVACEDGDNWDYRDRVFWIDLSGKAGTVAPASTISLADNTSNTTALSTNNGQTRNVVLEDRTLYRDGAWNTICLPFNLNETQLATSPLGGATVKTLSSTSFENGTLTLDFTDASTIVAGKPYIVKWETPADALANPTFWNVTISTAPNNIQTTYANFIGTYAPVEIGVAGDNTKLYLGNASTLYYPDGVMTIGFQRAYFQLKGIIAGDASGSVKSFVLKFGGDETASIQNPEIKIRDEGAWHSLDGRKLERKPTFKGLYIHNGKKTVIP